MSSFDDYIKKFCRRRGGFEGNNNTIAPFGRDFFATDIPPARYVGSISEISDALRYNSNFFRKELPEEHRRILTGRRRSGKTTSLVGIAMSVLENENRDVIFVVQNRHIIPHVMDIILNHPYFRECFRSGGEEIRNPNRGNKLFVTDYDNYIRHHHPGGEFKILDELRVEGDFDLISITGKLL